ncbi:MAG: GNAT family N-acetyltransferase [Nitrososphaera sp.]
MTRVFVREGYTGRQDAERTFAISELRKRGEIILAALSSGELAGMVIFVRPSSPARQVAKQGNEAEIHLLAVDPRTRRQGIASCLVVACEQRAISSGYSMMVLSTQPAMKSAHQLYKRLGYRRNAARDWSSGAKTYQVYESPFCKPQCRKFILTLNIQHKSNQCIYSAKPQVLNIHDQQSLRSWRRKHEIWQIEREHH